MTFGSTVKLLEEFMNAGGKVVAVEPLPAMIEGDVCSGIDKVFKHSGMSVIKNIGEMNALLEKLLPRRVSIRKGRDRVYS